MIPETHFNVECNARWLFAQNVVLYALFDLYFETKDVYSTLAEGSDNSSNIGVKFTSFAFPGEVDAFAAFLGRRDLGKQDITLMRFSFLMLSTSISEEVKTPQQVRFHRAPHFNPKI